MIKKKLGLAVGLAALLATAYVGFRESMGGNVAPDVEFITLKGEHIRLSELRGHPVLVTFWASDCRACLEEMPDLAEIHQQFSKRGFKLISVAMAYDLPNRVAALAEDRQLPYSLALDPLGAIAAAFEQVSLVPNNFLIAPDGRIIQHTLGRIRAEDIRARIQLMLDEV